MTEYLIPKYPSRPSQGQT